MSRSIKKPYITDQSCGPHYGKDKRPASRKVRAMMKKALMDDAYDIKDGKTYTRVYDSWKIRDWSFHNPKDKKAYRK